MSRIMVAIDDYRYDSEPRALAAFGASYFAMPGDIAPAGLRP